MASHISHVYFLRKDHSPCTINLDLVVFKFDPRFKTFNLGHNFLTGGRGAFIFHMFIPFDNSCQHVPLLITKWF